MEKKEPFNRVKETIEETSGRATEEGSLFQDAIDVTCTEKSNKSQFTGYINRKSDTNIRKVSGSRRRQRRTRHL